jgi:hypothetical protein
MIVLSPQPYRRMVRVLREFEGWRCLWRLPLAAVMFLAVVLLPLVGTVAGIYIGASLKLICVVAGAAVTLGSAGIASAMWRRKPWRGIVARRLWTFEAPAPATEVPVLVRNERDVDALCKAMRRAHFNPSSMLHVGTPPDDAPDLRFRVTVQEPERWKRSSSDADRLKRIADVLRKAGVRARVAGLDVVP